MARVTLNFEERLQAAQRLADQGRIEQAYELFDELFYERDSTLVAATRSRLRDMLLTKLRRRFADPLAMVTRLCDNDEIKRHRLRAREAFLLGLMDGALTLDDILAISPVDELDTLLCLAKLADLRLIAIGSTKGAPD